MGNTGMIAEGRDAKTGMTEGECEENERGYWSYCL